MPAVDFFIKCLSGELEEKDFDFVKPYQPENQVKGSVRKKIKALPIMNQIFTNQELLVQENFVKNRIKCTFATTDNQCTVGFIKTSKVHPMTLLKGNELDENHVASVKLLLRRIHGQEKFEKIIIGNKEMLEKYMPEIKELISDSLINL